MRNLLVMCMALAAGSAVWGQGSSDNGQAPTPGAGSGVTSFPGGSGGIPIPVSTFKAQCMASLSGFAAEKLQAQLLKDKAVSRPVWLAAKLQDGQLGAACAKACDDYAVVSNKISWAHVSPGFLSEPEHTLQKMFGAMPKPALPGKTELASCLPQQATLNWCPPSGSGVGAGPSRIENPLDKIRVCITGGEAFQHMNFADADAAHGCARPGVVDAAERIKAEHGCVADIAKAAADKLAAEKAAALKAAVYSGPPINANSGITTVTPAARKKP